MVLVVVVLVVFDPVVVLDVVSAVGPESLSPQAMRASAKGTMRAMRMEDSPVGGRIIAGNYGPTRETVVTPLSAMAQGSGPLLRTIARWAASFMRAWSSAALGGTSISPLIMGRWFP